ncbi:hypothetical protein PMV_218 [Port-miou virus]|uniref:Uncharacterized protein n=1 Tax=Port-miou virus TaxID=1733873 RepID=A0A0N9PVL3_9VIRU|nr:hypothetical protein PMV_218 [Port-miou virus]
MQDHDSIGYWLKGIPYIWVPSSNFRDSKRYYFANKGTVVFSDTNRTATQGVWMRTSGATGSDQVLEFSLSFFSCIEWPRNYFLVVPFDPLTWIVKDSKLFYKPAQSWLEAREFWGTQDKDFEFRVEGKKVDLVPAMPEYLETVDLTIPKKKLVELELAPPELFRVFSYPILGVSKKIVSVSSKSTGKYFWNIVQLATSLQLPLEERKTLHEECLGLKKSEKHDFLYDFLEDEEKKERGKVCATWYNDIWSGKIVWNGPIYADDGIMDHEPYQLDIA